MIVKFWGYLVCRHIHFVPWKKHKKATNMRIHNQQSWGYNLLSQGLAVTRSCWSRPRTRFPSHTDTRMLDVKCTALHPSMEMKPWILSSSPFWVQHESRLCMLRGWVYPCCLVPLHLPIPPKTTVVETPIPRFRSCPPPVPHPGSYLGSTCRCGWATGM